MITVEYLAVFDVVNGKCESGVIRMIPIKKERGEIHYGKHNDVWV